MKKALLYTSLSAAALAVSACQSSGGSGGSPDEFRVVTKAPLTVPPEYRLRPPQAGIALPAEVNPELAGRVESFGSSVGTEASASEKALVAYAGANAVSPLVRAQVDYEEAKTLRKGRSVVDRVIFWRGDEDEGEDAATGGGEITMERASGSPRLKLPGT